MYNKDNPMSHSMLPRRYSILAIPICPERVA